MKQSSNPLVNLGCGSRFHKDWYNIDIKSHSEHVRECNLMMGIPIVSNTVSACYSSHVLEHILPDQANFFIQEQYRVLKSGGIVRIVVPDLETICRLYIKYLDELKSDISISEFKYDYTILELLDQSVRQQQGGQLRKVWKKLKDKNISYVERRHGKEYSIYKKNITDNPKIYNPGIFSRLCPTFIKNINFVKYYQEGKFRNSGEIHQFMYDEFSLARILRNNGFENIKKVMCNESLIPNFNAYQLDSIDNIPHKPDSLYMEGICKK